MSACKHCGSVLHRSDECHEGVAPRVEVPEIPGDALVAELMKCHISNVTDALRAKATLRWARYLRLAGIK